MKRRRTRFRALILVGTVLALVAAACTSADTTTPETVIVEVEVPGQTVTSIVEVEVEVPTGGELITIVARCKANPPTENGRCDNLLKGVVDANATLKASGDSRRVEVKTIR